jgi:fructokinase
MLAGIESGGTKTICAVGPEPDRIVDRLRVPTGTDPQATLAAIADFIAGHATAADPLTAVGIGSFGPCDPDPASATFGYVTATPKPGWRGVDVVGILRQLLAERGLPDVPIRFDTDVNVAALAESRYGAGRGAASLVYLTVGTGIGGGAMVEGSLVHGLMHPEMGHVRIPRPSAEVAAFGGVCPYHGDCWEGVAAGPAIAARWGARAETLPEDHPAWTLEAEYLAVGLHAIVCMLSPHRIVLGGGVGALPHLVSRVGPLLQQSLAGYIAAPQIVDDVESYVVPTSMAGDAGVVGALALAADGVSP